MPVTYTLTAGPAAEPVSLPDAKAHVREDGAQQDALITALIKAAREYVEGLAGRQLMPATARERFDCFPDDVDCPLRLTGVPVRSVTSVTYVDVDGVTQTWNAALYRVDTESEPARITPEWGEVWPVARDVLNAVTVTYEVGFADSASVPQSLKQAVLLLVGHWYENREAVGTVGQEIELAVGALIERWAVYTQ